MAANMFYSSESSDSENTVESSTLDLSYLMLDTDSLVEHLKNSIKEQYIQQKCAWQTCSQSTRRDRDSVQEGRCEDRDRALVSHLELEDCEVRKESAMENIHDTVTQKLLLQHNMLLTLPFEITKFSSLKSLDLSNNNLTHVNDFLLHLPELQSLYLHNNNLGDDGLPKELSALTRLRELNLSGNKFTRVQPQLYEVVGLKYLYLGGNQITEVSPDIKSLQRLHCAMATPITTGNGKKTLLTHFNKLARIRKKEQGLGNTVMGREMGLPESMVRTMWKNREATKKALAKNGLQVLHLGGNLLETVPDELGELHQLGALILCNNKLRRLPRVISSLTRLRSLLLHKNNLCCLPVGLVKLKGLMELSLRDNPLVTKFVNSCARELMYNPPSLLELAARVIKLKKMGYTRQDLPQTLVDYLGNGQRCVNPKCKGMYFTSCVEHIKFVDFCGMYRVPLMHYLCSSRCSSKTPDYYQALSSESESEEDEPTARMKRVLLG